MAHRGGGIRGASPGVGEAESQQESLGGDYCSQLDLIRYGLKEEENHLFLDLDPDTLVFFLNIGYAPLFLGYTVYDFGLT